MYVIDTAIRPCDKRVQKIARLTLKLRLVPVPVDAGGVRVEPFVRALETSRAKLIYLQPTIANPHGATLAGERRQKRSSDLNLNGGHAPKRKEL